MFNCFPDTYKTTPDRVATQSGFTALFYAVDLAAPTILSALLRRGADPNTTLKLSVCVQLFH